MKKLSLLFLLLFICNFNAQIKYEPGYFIDNTNLKKEVLIKNEGWKNNPEKFEYKNDNSSQAKTLTINNVKEFGVNDKQRFIRKTVSIDLSSEEINRLTDDKEINFKEKTIFLNYVIQGKASLLSYHDGNIKKYFYMIDESEPKQLVYKPFLLNQSQISYNKKYQDQIKENLICDNITSAEISQAKYNQNDLSKLFTKYNSCSNNQTIDYKEKRSNKDAISLSIRPGVVFSSVDITSQYNKDNYVDFGSKTLFRIGIELEYTLPFNRNKWAVFAEPNFQYFKDEKTIEIYEQTRERSIDYKNIQIPFGIRHYFFLNDNSKIFLNGALAVNAPIKSDIKFSNDPNASKISIGTPIIFGAGYKYNNKFAIEVRYSKQTLLRNYVSVESNYSNFSVILGYNLF
ncbi:hypothetical protein D3C71_36380 [compost metagenome]